MEGVRRVSMGEMVEVLLPDGDPRRGQVIEFSDRFTVVQMLEEPTGIDVRNTRVRFAGTAAELLASQDPYLKEFLFMTLPPW